MNIGNKYTAAMMVYLCAIISHQIVRLFFG